MNTIDLYKQLDVLVVSAYVSQQRNHLNALLDIAEMKRSEHPLPRHAAGQDIGTKITINHHVMMMYTTTVY